MLPASGFTCSCFLNFLLLFYLDNLISLPALREVVNLLPAFALATRLLLLAFWKLISDILVGLALEACLMQEWFGPPLTMSTR